MSTWNSLVSFIQDEIVRTNNTIEGWHLVFGGKTNNHAKSLLLVSKLRDEEDAIRIKKIKIYANVTECRKKKYMEMGNNVRDLFNSRNSPIVNISDLIILIRLLFD